MATVWVEVNDSKRIIPRDPCHRNITVASSDVSSKDLHHSVLINTVTCAWKESFSDDKMVSDEHIAHVASGFPMITFICFIILNKFYNKIPPVRVEAGSVGWEIASPKGLYRLLSSKRVWSNTWCISRFSSLAWARFSGEGNNILTHLNHFTFTFL